MGHLKTYCDESTIHGFKYIGETNRHLTEKIFWTLTLIISSICCGFLIFELIEKVQKNPIVIYLADVGVPVSEIQFPSVTFCPEINTNVSGFDYETIVKMIENNELDFDNLTDFGLGVLHAVGLLMNDNLLLINNITVGSDNIMTHIKRIQRPWHDGHSASWMNLYKVHMAEIITPWGFCCNFNMINPEDLFHLNRTAQVFNFTRPYLASEFITELTRLTYETDLPYPWKTQSSRLGFHMNAHTYKFHGWNFFFLDKISTHPANIFLGHHFILHNCHELPDFTSKQFYAPINQTINIFINPQISIADESLHDFTPEERNCYFENEKKLNYFKIYSKQNCEQECQSKYILRACGCVQHYMIRGISDRICNIWDKKCVVDADDTFNNQIRDSCKCYLSCDVVTYKYNSEITDYTGQDLKRTRSPSDVYVKFKAQEFYPSIRQKQFSLEQFFSFVGGLLGLFTGFSFLSFVEFIYFFTIRIGFIKLRSKNSKVSPITPKKSYKKRTFCEKFVKMVKDVKSYFILYLNESSIHGMVYFGNNKKHWVERIFWLIFFILSMITCGFLINELHQKFMNNPIIMTMDDKQYQVQHIPFPAITVFGEFEFSPRYSILYDTIFTFDDEVEMYLEENHLLLDCLTQIIVCKKFEFRHKFEHLYGYGDQITPVIKNYSRNYWFKEQIGIWNNEFSVPFSEILTKRGYGFTFNALDSSDIYDKDIVSSDLLYERNIELNKNVDGNKLNRYDHEFPWSTSAKLTDGLKLVLKKNSTLPRLNACLMDGFAVHNNFDMPLQTEKSDMCLYAYGISMDVIITPEVINTDPDLISYSVERRQCYLEGERKLNFFKVYSKNNCEAECLSNFTLKTCHCVPFYSVREQATRVCTVIEEHCVVDVAYEVKYNPKSKFSKLCNCLSPCSTITYSVEYHETSFTNKKAATSNYKNGDEFIVTFKYRDNDYIPLRRYQQYTIVDFLANCGGLLGLFAGVSVLSIVELVYFFSLRIIANLLRKCIHLMKK